MCIGVEVIGVVIVLIIDVGSSLWCWKCSIFYYCNYVFIVYIIVIIVSGL